MQTPNVNALGRPAEAPSSAAPAPAAGGPSFQALLEKLEQSAAGLASQAPTSPGDLSGAVGDARASLDAALELGRDLVEAYREAHLQTGDLKQAG